MSELNYKELQEQGVFDIPYKAFEYMQKQQKRIDDAVALLEYNEYVDSPLQALEVLKDIR